MDWCLLPKHIEKINKMIDNGQITAEKLLSLKSSKERVDFFNKIIEHKETARKLAVQFESKLLLKNVEAGVGRWLDRARVPKEVKTDMISKIMRNEKLLERQSVGQALEEIVAQRLGKRIGSEDAKAILELTKNLSESKKGTIEYGASRVALENYISGLRSSRGQRKLITFREKEGTLGKVKGAVEDVGYGIKRISDVAKQTLTGADNSFHFRQFLTVATNPKTFRKWLNNFGKTWSEFGETVVKGKNRGVELHDGAVAEVYGRKNMDLYQTKGGKLEIGIPEEAYPQTIAERVPVIGRAFQAGRIAAEAGSTRLRADLADLHYELAKKKGVDLSDPAEVGAINKYVNSITGRGDIKLTKGQTEMANVALFSVKNLKSTIDTFTNPIRGGSEFVRAEALFNLMSFSAVVASSLAIAKTLNPDSVELDPRSSDFGQIKIGDTRFDLTGGRRGLVTLASRLITHSTKSSVTGQLTELGSYGGATASTLLTDFVSNKAAPMSRLMIDLVEQETMMGEPITPKTIAETLFKPILIDTVGESAKTDGALTAIASAIAELNGVGVNSYVFYDNWGQKDSKEMVKYRDRVGDKEFVKANEYYNEQVQAFLNSDKYKNAPDDDSKRGRKSILTSEKSKQKKRAMSKFR